MSCLEKRDNRSKMESPVPSLHHQTQTIPNLTAGRFLSQEGHLKCHFGIPW